MEEKSGAEPLPAQAPSSGGFSFRGLYEVIFAPTSFFNKLKNNPKILVPYVAFGILLIFSLYMIRDLMAQMQLEAMRNSGQTPPRQAMKWITISSVVLPTIFLMLGPLVAALLAMFWGNFVMAGRARFKQLLSIMLYGEIIYALGFLIMMPVMLYKKTVLVSLSLAALLSNPDPNSLSYVLLSKIGVFYIWEWIVIGIGLSIVYGFSRNKGFVLAVLSMGLLSLLQVLMAAIGLA